VLVGRETECERLDGLLSDARSGRSGNLLFRGDPGVGKTALLDYAIQRAEDFNVLHVSGAESEAELPYSGLHAVVRPIAELIAVLPDLQARALRVALALEEGTPDPFVAGAGTLTLLAEAADRKPVLLAVDDAQWLDRASMEALLFAARRLEAERVALVFVVREGEGEFGRRGLDDVAVSSLDEASALVLLRERWGSELAASVAQKLVAATGGNPLALVEVAGALTDDERRGVMPLADALPVSDAVDHAVRLKLSELPDEARKALVLAAVADSQTDLVNPAELATAERVGLVRLHRDRVVFMHPLFRAAVYHSVSAEDRRSAHRRLAEALTNEGEEDLRAWHLAAASDGPDESVASALEAAAVRAEARGGTAARARALERAAALSEDEHERVRRLIGAANAARVAGETRRAKEIVEQILPTVEDPLLHADLVQELCAVMGWHGPPLPVELLEREADAVAKLDPERAAKLLGVITSRHIDNELDALALNRVADRIEVLLPDLGEWWRGRAIGWVAHARLLGGDAPRARELFLQILDDPLATATQAPALMYLELYAEAEIALDESLRLGRSSSQALRIAWSQACLAQLHRARNRYPEAIAAASEATSVAEEIEAESIAASAVLTSANIAAEQGRVDECRRLVGRAEELAAQLADENCRLLARVMTAKLALAAGQHEEVVRLLRPVAERLAEARFKDPSAIPYGPELIEAYARIGETSEARRELDRFGAQAEAAERRSALAAAARCEGLLASESAFDEWFRAALVHHELVPSRFEEARTRLCYGERLRRSRRRRDAREQLRAAITTFDDLGATPWATRARAELEATGERIPRRDPTAPERLTPQELQIALQVAEGKTNREVAAALFLSPKTVEHHLTHVYRKLDLHSRAELIRLLAREGAESALVAP